MTEKLRNYWLNAPVSKTKVIAEAQADALARYAINRKLVVHDGKAIRPDQYPCLCAIHCGSPRACWEKAQELRHEENFIVALPHVVCTCPCHAYQDGDGAA